MINKVQIGALYKLKKRIPVLCVPTHIHDFTVYGLLISDYYFEIVHVGSIERFLEAYEEYRKNF